MRTIVKFILVAFAMVSAIACNDIIESEESLSFPEKEIILTATREGLAPGTRSFRLDDGSVWWSPSEEVSVFYGSGSNGGSKFVSKNTAIAETVELQGSVQMAGSGKDFWAVYPYSEDNSCDGSSITTVIPDKQTGVEGNFSDDMFPAVAKSKTLDLAFWNICGGIKFFVSRSDIKSVTFKGNNREALAGKVKVTFDTNGVPAVSEVIDGKSEVTLTAPEGGTFKTGKYYYLTLLPAALDSGFTMTFNTDTEEGTVVSNNAQTIKRSFFGVLKNIDSKVSSWEINIVEPEWVDLGLPSGIKWATFNVGATKPEESGDYFAWGETEPKTVYSWSTYKFRTSGDNWENIKVNKYCIQSSYWDSSAPMDHKTILDLDDDAAHVNLNGSWRMPTDAEWTELRENCTWTWISDYNGTGVAGTIVASNKAGYTDKSIFLPAAGYRSGTYLYDAGSGYYWSLSLLYTGYPDSPTSAWSVRVRSSEVRRLSAARSDGQSVRPVYAEYIPVQTISLNQTELELAEPLETYTLIAEISPQKATDMDICWASDDESVVIVDDYGLVTAVGSGLATITAYASSGISSTCNVTVKDVVSTRYEYIDLGLSVKWATMNVGATKPEESGDYFAWGETKPKAKYSWSTYKWGSSTNSLTKYTKSFFEAGDNKTRLDLADDAARMNWGGRWRMPTNKEWTELVDNCTWSWTSNYNGTGITGMIVVSNKTGYTDKSIFFPSTGQWGDSGLDSIYSSGYYWSSSNYTSGNVGGARYLLFSFNHYQMLTTYRYYGQTIRPVCT